MVAQVGRGSTWVMKEEDVKDTDAWLQNRLEHISELELEGAPSRALNLDENTSVILSNAVHSMFAHKVPYLHSPTSDVSLMTPSQARIVQEIMQDVGEILDNEKAHRLAADHKEVLTSKLIA